MHTNEDKLFVPIRNTIRSFLCVATRFSSCGNLTADFTHEERDFFAATSLRHSDFGYSDFGFWLRPWPRWAHSWQGFLSILRNNLASCAFLVLRGCAISRRAAIVCFHAWPH